MTGRQNAPALRADITAENRRIVLQFREIPLRERYPVTCIYGATESESTSLIFHRSKDVQSATCRGNYAR